MIAEEATKQLKAGKREEGTQVAGQNEGEERIRKEDVENVEGENSRYTRKPEE